MDSSSRPIVVDVILGSARVNFHEVTHDEMAELLFDNVIKGAKPTLKYLPRFTPILTMLNCMIAGNAQRFTEIEPHFPQGISEKTKVVEVDIIDEAKTDVTVVQRILLLTDDGYLLLWAATYKRKKASTPYSSQDEFAEESCFTLLTREVIHRFAVQQHLWPKNWKMLMLEVIRCIQRLTGECVEEREKYLKSVQDVDKLVRGALSRICV